MKVRVELEDTAAAEFGEYDHKRWFQALEGWLVFQSVRQSPPRTRRMLLQKDKRCRRRVMIQQGV